MEITGEYWRSERCGLLLANHVAALWAGKVLAMERFFPDLVDFIAMNLI